LNSGATRSYTNPKKRPLQKNPLDRQANNSNNLRLAGFLLAIEKIGNMCYTIIVRAKKIIW
jgi:hypothetical protein